MAKKSPQAGYDQLGKSYYCLECSKQWYGDKVPCRDKHCPFKKPAERKN